MLFVALDEFIACSRDLVISVSCSFYESPRYWLRYQDITMSDIYMVFFSNRYTYTSLCVSATAFCVALITGVLP